MEAYTGKGSADELSKEAAILSPRKREGKDRA